MTMAASGSHIMNIGKTQSDTYLYYPNLDLLFIKPKKHATNEDKF